MFVFCLIYEILRAYTNPMFVFSSFSTVFPLQIRGYKPYVRVSSDFWSISHTNPRLQTLCSLSTVLYINLKFQTFFAFSLRFLWYLIQINSYKPYVYFTPGFHNISNINLRLQTLCSFFVEFIVYV